MKTNSLTVALLWLAIIVAALVGWVMNIVAIFHSNFSSITGELVLRVIGVFVAPLGSIMGLFV